MKLESYAALGVPLAPARPADTDPRKIHDSAVQFESLLIAQLLKTSLEAGGAGWLGTGDDEAGSIGVEIAGEHLARMLAANGGIGLARLIERGLTADAQRAKDAEPAPTPPPKESAG